jgi:hypothetical protein
MVAATKVLESKVVAPTAPDSVSFVLASLRTLVLAPEKLRPVFLEPVSSTQQA